MSSLFNLLLFLGSFLLVCTGAYFRFYWAARREADPDTWFHLLVSEKWRKKGRMPESLDNFVLKGPYDYPPLFHYVLKLLPEETAYNYRLIFSPIIDIIHLLAVFIAGKILIGGWIGPLIAAGVYGTTPELFEHHLTLNPRPLGSLLLTFVLFLLMLYSFGQGSMFLFLCLLIGAMIFLTHKMTTQAFVLVLISIGIVALDPLYFLVIIGSLIMAVLLSGGHYFVVLLGHLAIVDFWKKQFSDGKPPGIFYEKYGLSNNNDDVSIDGVLNRLRLLHKKFGFIRFLMGNPWLYLLLVLLPVFGLPEGEAGLIIVVWALSLLVVALLTQYVPTFKMFGQGNRYYTYSSVPSALFLGANFREAPVAIGLIFLLFGVMMLVYVHQSMERKSINSQKFNFTACSGLIDTINQFGAGRIMALPYNLSYALAYLTNKEVLWHYSPVTYMEGADFFPIPNRTLCDLSDAYKIDLLLIDKSRVDIKSFELNCFEKVYQDGDFVLYRRD